MIITIRTDKPEAEVTVHDKAGKQLSFHQWLAHRQLSSTLLGVMRDELQKRHAQWHDITGIVVFQGPGSFTGLRIGLTVANSLAYGLSVPIVGATGENWRTDGIDRLTTGKTDTQVLPIYGAEANITLPKK